MVCCGNGTALIRMRTKDAAPLDRKPLAVANLCTQDIADQAAGTFHFGERQRAKHLLPFPTRGYDSRCFQDRQMLGQVWFRNRKSFLKF